MTAVRALEDYRVRLRHAAEAPGGPRVVIARDDLLLLLSEPAATPPVSGVGVDAIPPPRPARQPPSGRGDRVIALSTGIADVKRLAQAAWSTSPELVAEHGDWWRGPLHLRQACIDAARRCLGYLADPPYDPPPA